MTAAVTIRHDLRPGDLGRLIALHGTAYEDGDAHFGLVFEAFVAQTVAEFILGNRGAGRIWFAEAGDRLLATAAMVERREGQMVRGQLRWIVADPAARGRGIGKALIDRAMRYARDQGYAEVFLETTDGLDASMAIYRKLGFEVVSRERQALWQGDNVVITMRLKLG